MYALEKNKHIVPVNPDGAFKSFPEGIPEEITKDLGDEQHSDIMFGQLFNKSVEKMDKEGVSDKKLRKAPQGDEAQVPEESFPSGKHVL